MFFREHAQFYNCLSWLYNCFISFFCFFFFYPLKSVALEVSKSHTIHDAPKSASYLLSPCLSSHLNFKQLGETLAYTRRFLVSPQVPMFLCTIIFYLTCMEFCGAEQPPMVLRKRYTSGINGRELLSMAWFVINRFKNGLNICFLTHD